MPIDPTRRISNWDAKYETERIKAVLDARRPAMLSRFTAVTPVLAEMEISVKQVLDGQGVATIRYPFYLDFGREVWALQGKGVSGESLKQEVAVLVAKWEARGLELPVLQAIRDDVFNVGAPSAP